VSGAADISARLIDIASMQAGMSAGVLAKGAGSVETRMRRRHLGSHLATIPVIAGVLIALHGIAGAGEPHAFLELFTSQGCSSCPPADQLLGELAVEPGVVALSLPIDYWDYLGWKDTLANPAHSARQRAYAHVRGDREVYTPQIVVNGSMHVLGSDRAAVEHMIVQTERNSAVMSLPVHLSIVGGDLTVTAGPAAKEHLTGEVWLCALDRAVTVAIGRGENSGRTVTYHNVVRRWLKLGDWTGTAASWTVPTSEVIADGADGAAVLVQEGTREKPGVILGAAISPVAQHAAVDKSETIEAQ
jgi:hypothetical protein